MSPPDFADAYDTSLPGPAFSNSTEGDAWTAAWCGTCTNCYPRESGCELVDVARIGRLPAAWDELDPGSLVNRYFCHSWVPVAGYIGDFSEIRP